MSENKGAGLFSVFDMVCMLLTFVFAVLRACDVTDWAWYIVLLPLFIDAVITLATLIVIIVLSAILAHRKE